MPVDEYDDVQRIGAPLMPALGAAFGVLIGLTLASEAGYLKSAQDIVADEAATASRLAWAATSPGVNSEPIHRAVGAVTDNVVRRRLSLGRDPTIPATFSIWPGRSVVTDAPWWRRSDDPAAAVRPGGLQAPSASQPAQAS